jgi:glucose/mannose-6-phosphate isomerase
MNMKELIETFTDQLQEAIAIGRQARFKPARSSVQNVLISGLGGSGIGATIVAQLTDKQLRVPVVVNKDYFIPAFVSGNTLVIICSYSGNTEETLQAMEEALRSQAMICCISSGGKVIERAQKNGLDHIIIPGGRPPRSAFAYSFTQLFYVLHGYGVMDRSFESMLTEAVTFLRAESDSIQLQARRLAEQLHEKIPVIYCDASMEGVAIRWRQQLNENAKMLCWHHVLPEMNHNELVGWTKASNQLAVVFLRNETDYQRTRVRMDLTRKIVSQYTPHVYEIWSKGNNSIERTLYLIHLGDWISWHLSDIKQIDATEVKVIDYLKSELARV